MIPFLPKRDIRESAIDSYLGHNCFRYRFEYEKALMKVLDNRRYQFAKWMIILQRWEHNHQSSCIMSFSGSRLKEYLSINGKKTSSITLEKSWVHLKTTN